MQDEEITPVVFRAEKAGDFKGDVTAVFLTLPGTVGDPGNMTCYAHIGQHSACSWALPGDQDGMEGQRNRLRGLVLRDAAATK